MVAVAVRMKLFFTIKKEGKIVAYFRCGSIGGGGKLTLSAGAVVCRMAGDDNSRPFCDCNLGVKLSDMIAMGYKSVTVTISKGPNFVTSIAQTSLEAFGVSMGLGTKTINLSEGTKDGIGGRIIFNRGYSGQDGFQEIISVTATFTK